jgi:hypothetical protein
LAITAKSQRTCLFNQARWRQLRSCAGSLHSITWKYRARVAPFEPNALHRYAETDKAEHELRLALIEWREKLAAGADLNSTTLRRSYPFRVFKHDQRCPPDETRSYVHNLAYCIGNEAPDKTVSRCWRLISNAVRKVLVHIGPRDRKDSPATVMPVGGGSGSSDGGKVEAGSKQGGGSGSSDGGKVEAGSKQKVKRTNDHFSPVTAQDYIELRLQQEIDRYQQCVPMKALERTTIKVLLLIATVVSSVLARYSYNQMVTIVTAFASAITSLSEFEDAGRKLER